MDHPVLIITGASHGIGAAAAEIAASKGARVTLNARNPEALDGIARRIREQGGEAMAVAGDVSRAADCQAIIEQTLRTYGRLDALINNAAIIGPLNLITDLSMDEWARTLEVNLLGPALMCHVAIPHLRATAGRIVNVSSGAAVFPVAGGSAYCSAKAGLNHLTKILSMEEPALTMLAYNPGDVDTPMQAEIRAKGNVAPFSDLYQYFVEQHEQGLLVPAERAALGAVTLALSTPHEWTGEFVQLEEERVQELMTAL